MAQVNKPYTFGPNTTISSSNVNDNFDTIYDEFNGNITEANLADDAVTENKIADGSVTTAKLAAGLVDNGWVALSGTASVSTGYNKGNREYDLTFNTDLSATLSEGMRLKLDRGTAPPTQCTDLEASSSQYWSKSSPTGITFTDDFTCEAWIKLESNTGINQYIIGRQGAATNGFGLYISTSGQLGIFGTNTTSDIAVSNQSIPLNRWVHVAATLDMSGATATTYIDGVSVPNTYTNAAATTVSQAGNLTVGRTPYSADSYFDGEIADVRVWSAVRTATQIRDNMNQQLVGNETNLVAYFPLNGDANDLTSNANNLSANGGATATTVDNPMKDTEYAIITKVAYSAPNTTVTVFTGTDHNIPNMTLSNPYYSTQATPYGFPRAKGKWKVEGISYFNSSFTSSNFATMNRDLSVPTGAWNLSWVADAISSPATNPASARVTILTLSTTALSGTTSENDKLTSEIGGKPGATSTDSIIRGVISANDDIETTAQTVYTMYARTNSGSPTNNATIDTTYTPVLIKAECAYL